MKSGKLAVGCRRAGWAQGKVLNLGKLVKDKCKLKYLLAKGVVEWGKKLGRG